MFSHPKYTAITVSGKIAVGTTTLAKNLRAALDWKYQNAGSIQREFDRKEGRNDNESGAASRTDEHERSIEAMTEKMLKEEKNIIYEAWLANRPGAVVASGASAWTLAHEIGHVLGLSHVSDNNRLMTGLGTDNITNPPPDIIASEKTTMLASSFTN